MNKSKINKAKKLKPASVRFPHHKKLAKEYNESNSIKNYNIDNELCRGKLISYRIINIVVLVITVLYAVFISRLSYIRLWASIKDLGNAIAYYVLMFAPDVEFEPIINNLPDIDFSVLLPQSWDALKDILSQIPGMLFNADNFLNFLLSFSVNSLTFARVSLVAILGVIAVYTIVDILLSKANGKLLERSKRLKKFERVQVKKIILPVRSFVIDYFRYNKGHYFFGFLKFLWLCNLNIMTVIVELIAYFFYFARSFNLMKIYIQIYRLVLDAGIFLKVTFALIYIPLIYKVFHNWRINIALKRMRGGEAHNQQFINKRSMALIITASMGAGKTTLLTDICLSLSLMFRNEALKRMFKYQKYFPNFEWTRLRKYMDLWTKKRVVRNLATIENHIRKMRKEFEEHPCKANIFFYDYDTYRTNYHNGLLRIQIWDAIETYCKLYFVYVMETSLICSNYPVREDYFIINAGNLVKFNGDFFSKPITQDTTHYSHILPYDTLRMGKTLIKDAEYRNSFEFGIIAMTEGGKERGNALENLCVKQTDEECNAKNDYFETRVMMSRHPAVIDNFPFIKFLLDEQRAMTLNASFRELCEVIDIQDNSSPRIFVPFFYIEYAIWDILNNLLGKINNRYETTHGDMSLPMYLFKNILLWIINPMERIINKYTYHTLTVNVGKATSDERNKYVYILSDYKIYRDRFSTNTHNCYFRKRAEKSPIGIVDYPCYTTTEMNDVELHMQGSLWIEKLDKLSNQVVTDEDLEDININRKIKNRKK